MNYNLLINENVTKYRQLHAYYREADRYKNISFMPQETILSILQTSFFQEVLRNSLMKGERERGNTQPGEKNVKLTPS